MTSFTRSSITGLYHPKRSHSNSLPLSPPVDRLLNADRSISSVKRSRTNSLTDVEMKRVVSVNETLQSTIKRLRMESNHSIDDLRNKNETLEKSIQQSNSKITELEILLERFRTQSNATEKLQENISKLENDKIQLKSQIEQLNISHSKELIQLQQTINNFKHQLVDNEHQLQLIQFDRDQLQIVHQRKLDELREKNEQFDQLQKRVEELETIVSTRFVASRSTHSDVQRLNDLRYENDQLKRQIELLKFKSTERLASEEELRMLRKQVEKNHDYRALIAKQEAEITKLREQVANSQSEK